MLLNNRLFEIETLNQEKVFLAEIKNKSITKQPTKKLIDVFIVYYKVAFFSI